MTAISTKLFPDLEIIISRYAKKNTGSKEFNSTFQTFGILYVFSINGLMRRVPFVFWDLFLSLTVGKINLRDVFFIDRLMRRGAFKKVPLCFIPANGNTRKVMLLDVRVTLLDVRVILSDVRVTLSDVRVTLSDVRVILSDVRVALSDVRVTLSDVRVTLSDVREALSDVRVTLSDVRVTFSDVREALSDVRVRLSGLQYCLSGVQNQNIVISNIRIK
jgi:hypothetical protein